MKASTYYGGSEVIDLGGGGEVTLPDPSALPHLFLGRQTFVLVNKTGGTVTAKKINGDTAFTVATGKVAKVSCYDTTYPGVWRASVHDLLEV